jgi:hypothetical protein
VGGLLALCALAGGEYVLFTGAAPTFSEFKAIYAPMNTPGARVVAEIRAPRGHYLLLDNFTERVDADVSNNAGLMGIPGATADLWPLSRRQPYRLPAEGLRPRRRLCVRAP